MAEVVWAVIRPRRGAVPVTHLGQVTWPDQARMGHDGYAAVAYLCRPTDRPRPWPVGLVPVVDEDWLRAVMEEPGVCRACVIAARRLLAEQAARADGELGTPSLLTLL